MASSETVTVACKLPQGIILRIDEMKEDGIEPTRTGTLVVSRAHKVAEIVLKGWNDRLRGSGEAANALRGHYELTHNVPKDLWDRWEKANAESDLVKNKVVFAYSKPEAVATRAKEEGSRPGGAEPLDVSIVTEGGVQKHKDPRIQLNTLNNGFLIQKADLNSPT